MEEKEPPKPEAEPKRDCRENPKSVTFANETGEIDAWDDYWEDMLRISRGPRGWNVGCA
ncbi:MAG: hypothetical protein NT009_00965 [Proteobacteria bacterium]|nr:hypothetical protein [Pseudomonadota bacterium]